jgi:hypothetical protein
LSGHNENVKDQERRTKEVATMSDDTERSVAMRGSPLAVGEYVLATKYDDGDAGDHFFVGFVSGYTHHGRYLVVDNDGRSQRANGFRRAERITTEEGSALVAMFPDIGDKPGPSLWWHLDRIRCGSPDV